MEILPFHRSSLTVYLGVKIMCMFSLCLGSLSLLSSVKLLPNPQVSQISLNSNSYICPTLEEYGKKGGEMRLWELMKRSD